MSPRGVVVWPSIQPDKTCVECGKLFPPKTSTSIVCGAPCRGMRKRRKNNEATKKYYAAAKARWPDNTHTNTAYNPRKVAMALERMRA